MSLLLAQPTNKKTKIPEKVKNKEAKCVVDKDGSIKPFSQVKVSTRTAIVVTNTVIDLENLFKYTPITDFEPQKKRRGRKKRLNTEKHPAKIPFGSVIKVQHELKVRGADLKNKDKPEEKTQEDSTDSSEELRGAGEEEKKRRSYFLHCVTMIVSIIEDGSDENNFKNVKIYNNGKFQITGCKTVDDYINTAKVIFNLFLQIKEFTGVDVALCEEEYYQAVFNTVMINMDFNLGFSIFRNKLDQFIKNHTSYKSIFEGSMGSQINIKIPIESNDTLLKSITFHKTTKEIKQFDVNYSDYSKFFAKKNNNKEDEHTFLIFATGHVIFTSKGPSMANVFYNLIKTLVDNRQHFEEKEDKLIKL